MHAKWMDNSNQLPEHGHPLQSQIVKSGLSQHSSEL